MQTAGFTKNVNGFTASSDRDIALSVKFSVIFRVYQHFIPQTKFLTTPLIAYSLSLPEKTVRQRHVKQANIAPNYTKITIKLIIAATFIWTRRFI